MSLETIHALLDRGRVKEGETLLVLGAAGGVGLAAVELGKAFGARVVAAVSSEEKAEAAGAAGADRTLVYPRGPFDKEGAKALSQLFKEAVGPDGRVQKIDKHDERLPGRPAALPEMPCGPCFQKLRTPPEVFERDKPIFEYVLRIRRRDHGRT